MGRRSEVARITTSQAAQAPEKQKGASAENEAASASTIAPEITAAITQLVGMHEYAEDHFETRLTGHADWILIHLLLQNDAAGRGTVVKHVIETVGCSPGTVRTMFQRFHKSGYIEQQQRIGRSELYRPTAKLKKFVTKWAQNAWKKTEQKTEPKTEPKTS